MKIRHILPYKAFWITEKQPTVDLEHKILELEKALAESRQREHTLRRSNRLLQDMFNFLPDPTFVTDNKSQVVFWNREMEKLTGVKAEQIISKGDYEYALPFYGKRRPILIDLVVKDDERWRNEYISLRKDGRRLAYSQSHHPHIGKGGLYLSGAAAPLFDSDDRLIGAIETLRDVSETKAIERDLRQSKNKYRSILENMGEGPGTANPQIQPPGFKNQRPHSGFSHRRGSGKTTRLNPAVQNRDSKRYQYRTGSYSGRHHSNPPGYYQLVHQCIPRHAPYRRYAVHRT